MPITAKCDVFNVNPTLDVQPAAGEVWLITAFALPPGTTDVNAISIALWDGTDLGTLFDVSGASTTSTGVGVDLAGSANSVSWVGNSNTKVVITNTVRLRFTANGYVLGYTGVQLA